MSPECSVFRALVKHPLPISIMRPTQMTQHNDLQDGSLFQVPLQQGEFDHSCLQDDLPVNVNEQYQSPMYAPKSISIHIRVY